MNQLQLSTRQFFIILSATVLATLAVFSLGLLSATLIATPPQVVQADAGTPAADAPDEPDSPVAELIVPIDPPPAAVEPVSFGLQVAVFERVENATRFAAGHHDTAFRAQVFSRVEPGVGIVYPVLVGRYPTMTAAQQAKRAFNERFAADVFVTDASHLQEAPLAAPTVAMLH